jgi:hypothetical protein
MSTRSHTGPGSQNGTPERAPAVVHTDSLTAAGPIVFTSGGSVDPVVCRGRRARRDGRGHLGREVEVREDPCGGRGRVEHGDEAEPPAAPGAREHVDGKDATHEVGPPPATAGARAGAGFR